MSIETPDDAGTPERFIAKERDLIRREFMVRWGGTRSLHEGFFLRRWGSGPQKGTPKVGATIRSMLARGLVEIVDPKPGFPFACFTPAGIAALRAMVQHRGMLPPDQYGHLIEELETFPDPQGRRRRAPKATGRSEPVSEAPREPPSGPRPRRAVGRPPEGGGDGGQDGRKLGFSSGVRVAVCRDFRRETHPNRQDPPVSSPIARRSKTKATPLTERGMARMLGRWSAFSGLPAPPCIFLSSVGRLERPRKPPKSRGGARDTGRNATEGPVNTPCRRPPVYTSICAYG